MGDDARMTTVVSGSIYRWYRGESMKRGVSLASLIRVALIWYMTNHKEVSLYDNDKCSKAAAKAGAIPSRLVAALGFGRDIG